MGAGQSHLKSALDSLIPGFLDDYQQNLNPTDTVSADLLSVRSAQEFIKFFAESNLADNHHYVIVFDNFQLMNNEEILENLAIQLEYTPHNIHFVVSGNSSNPFSLARLKIRNQVATIDMSDLRFDNGEVADFFKLRSGKSLSAEKIGIIQTQFEGWAAGMQSFCLSPESKTITADVIQAFCHDNREFLEYIETEVLKDVSEDVKTFLMKSSVFDGFDCSLCDYVLERTDSRLMIDSLLDNNLVTIKTVANTTIYRYPHYLKQVAAMLLDNASPNLFHEYNQRASRYYEEEGLITRAVYYALQTKDYDRAARLVEENFWALYENGRFLTIDNRISQMPPEYIESNLYLLLIVVFGKAYFNRTDDTEPMVGHVKEMLAQERRHDPEHYDTRLDAMIHTFEALLYSQSGDIEKCIESAGKVLNQKDSQIALTRCSATMALGNGFARSRSSVQSISTLRQASLFARAENYMDVAALTSYHIAHAYLRQGQLGNAQEELERTISLLESNGDEKISHYKGVLYAPLGEIELERNNLELAKEYLDKGLAGIRKLVSLEYECDVSVSLSQLKFAEQKFRDSLDILENALIVAHKFENSRAIALMEAHLAVLHSRLGYHALAKHWADRFDPQAPQPDIPRKELEHLTYSHILISTNRFEEAMVVLDSLIVQAKAMHHIHALIRSYLQKSIAYYRMDMIRDAYKMFDQAFSYAKEESYIRIIIDETNVISDFLLEYAAFKSFSSDSSEQKYLESLIEASSSEIAAIPCSGVIMRLLSKRELEVYLLIQQGYTNKQIGEQLYISQETVKSHRKSINRKLEAGTRDGDDL